MKILAVGDMHLGRTPSRLPDDLLERARDFGPAEAWRRTVQTAIDHQVAAVLLAGDLVDKDDDFFEAYRALEDGVRRLTEAGIDVIGVAGNHDLKVLPRLVEHLPDFRLLGGGGRQWESCAISGNGEAVTVWGWSFPKATTGAAGNPLQDWTFPADELRGHLNLGLLHCDRDAGADSRYAPVSSSELASAGLDAWLLGHIHKPDALTAAAPSGYLGSLTGFDRGEPGPHGPWLITIAAGRLAALEQLPLAPLRWETLDVPLDDIGAPAEAQDRLLAKVREFDAALAAAGTAPDAVGLTITLTGRTRFGSAADKAIAPEDRAEIYRGSTGAHYFVHRLEVDTRPEIDLEELARQQTPVGMLARRLLWLDRLPDDEDAADQARPLLEGAARRLQEQAARTAWSGLGSSSDAPPDPVFWLRQAGMRALDELLAQIDSGEGEDDA